MRSGVGPAHRAAGALAGAVAVALLLGSTFGPAVAAAGVIVVVTAARSVGGLSLRRRRRRDIRDTCEGIRILGRELRAGADPARAAAAAAGVSSGSAVDLLRAVAAGTGAARDAPTTDRPESVSRGSPPAPEVLAVAARLRGAWLLSERHGVALGPQVDAIAETLARRQRASAEREAQLAGPRMSGWVLTALPGLGLLLGAGMGADPLAVLAGGGIGGVLLVAGTALTCGGLLWSARIARA